MKKTFLNIGLSFCLACTLLTACDDDNCSNPRLTSPTTFVVNTPATADQTIDLANSEYLNLTCSQPDYGFPANVKYTVQMALTEDMSDYTELAETFPSADINLDAETIASTLTTMETDKGKTEEDFPMTIPVYFRVKAQMITSSGSVVEGTEILSNVVSFNKVNLEYSLPPVTTPENLYVVGKFNNWQWNTAIEMTPVNSAPNVFWAMVFIDSGNGIKFNSALSWDGNQQGYDGITVGGDLASQIVDNEGNIASTVDQWYLMIVTTSVSGRTILYDVQFQEPNVYLMGPCFTPTSGWVDEQLDEAKFDIPTTMDGEFVSPTFDSSLPGGDDGDGVRAYVKVPGYDWWKSEFIVYDGEISYRGTDGDQYPRVACRAGQKLYLNFSTGKGEIK